MHTRELNRAVARATGETVSTIAQLGFQPLRAVPFEQDPERYIVDWDQIQLERNIALCEQT